MAEQLGVQVHILCRHALETVGANGGIVEGTSVLFQGPFVAGCAGDEGLGARRHDLLGLLLQQRKADQK